MEPLPAVSTRTTLHAAIRGAVVAVAIAVMNITTYGLTLASARLLGPGQFAQFSAVLGVLIVVNVVSLGMQTTAARRVARAAGDADTVSELSTMLLRATRRAAVVVTLGAAAFSPLVGAILELDSSVSSLALAAAAGLLTLMGGAAGVLQGESRWTALSWLYVSMGTARLVCGLAGIWVSRSAAGALIGVAIGASVPAALGWLAARRTPTTIPTHAPPVGADPEQTWTAWERQGYGARSRTAPMRCSPSSPS